MNYNEYLSRLNHYNNNCLSHAQGTRTWSNHKYLYKDGDKYIYPEDLKASKKANAYSNLVKGTSGYQNNADAAKYGGEAERWARQAANAKQERLRNNNADASTYGGEAERWARQAAAAKQERLRKQGIANNADAAKYGGEAERWARQAAAKEKAGKAYADLVKSTSGYQNNAASSGEADRWARQAANAKRASEYQNNADAAKYGGEAERWARQQVANAKKKKRLRKPSESAKIAKDNFLYRPIAQRRGD